MASLPSSKTITYDEWLRMPEVRDAIEEVVNGEIGIMPAPKWNHSIIVENIRDALVADLDRQEVRVVATTFGLIIRKRPLTSRIPDLAVFTKSSIVEQDGYIHSAPQLVVEVLSPANSRIERAEKLDDHASLGVPEVWVVSPEARTVEVLLLEAGSFRRSQILADGLLQPRLFPHVHVDIARIWPD
ncbi:MAG TPA: Uma2 family endonuclease [Candidatus Acidoferrales bacterium]|nr:Uma2 family endonuclease [Candidatus Acidoferrales bacterium]